MKRLVVFIALVLLPVALVAQTTRVRFTNEGAFASLSESSSSLSSFSLTVSNDTTNSVATANINFSSFAFAADFSSLTIVDVIGGIPPADFTGQSTKNLALNFSSADLLAGGISQTCTLNLITFTFTCGAGPTGTISVQWRENDAVTTQVLASNVLTTVANVTRRTHSRSDNSSATATGTVFGTTVMGGIATVGTFHTSTLCAAISPATCP